jgi:hypothetical protein
MLMKTDKSRKKEAGKVQGGKIFHKIAPTRPTLTVPAMRSPKKQNFILTQNQTVKCYKL